MLYATPEFDPDQRVKDDVLGKEFDALLHIGGLTDIARHDGQPRLVQYGAQEARLHPESPCGPFVQLAVRMHFAQLREYGR
ncbi:hypothetical protein [Paracoccus litorisediminis]|uniref:Uncharacterized protein n=1 Tax=Paracoccus litorisediminis TaxID=2006130 RepID=A0A844HQX9_9RHOB|nr:hypothetical protein [Paracoccus litorisediminis]MTH60002.1 hypothetical protein [Paracoccus litorisediminis]